jgi:hypothetical protein
MTRPDAQRKNPHLPRPYPGCWKNRAFLRVYKRVSERVRRGIFGVPAEKLLVRRKRSKDERARLWQRIHRRYLQKRRANGTGFLPLYVCREEQAARVAAAGGCFSCGARRGLRPIRRMVFEGQALVERRVLWCGRC